MRRTAKGQKKKKQKDENTFFPLRLSEKLQRNVGGMLRGNATSVCDGRQQDLSVTFESEVNYPALLRILRPPVAKTYMLQTLHGIHLFVGICFQKTCVASFFVGSISSLILICRF